MNKTSDKLFWGFCFIAAAAALILSKLGFYPEISCVGILFTVLFVWMLVKGLFTLNWFEICFSLALIACIYQKTLHIENLVPWTVLGAALLLSIGLNILFPHKSKRKNDFSHWDSYNPNPEIIDSPDQSDIHFENSFGSVIKYVNTDHFTSALLHSSFGEMQVYFDNAIMESNHAKVDAQVSFGCIRLFIPKTWNVIIDSHCSFGAVTEKNKGIATADSPSLLLTGKVAFGAVEIVYV